jgi:hypothetical protein
MLCVRLRIRRPAAAGLLLHQLLAWLHPLFLPRSWLWCLVPLPLPPPLLLLLHMRCLHWLGAPQQATAHGLLLNRTPCWCQGGGAGVGCNASALQRRSPLSPAKGLQNALVALSNHLFAKWTAHAVFTAQTRRDAHASAAAPAYQHATCQRTCVTTLPS